MKRNKQEELEASDGKWRNSKSGVAGGRGRRVARRIKKGSNRRKREIKEKPVQSDGRDASLRINR